MTATDPEAHPVVHGATSRATGPHISRARLDVRSVDAAHGVIITVTEALEPGDAKALNECLQSELDRKPSVIVVDLSGVPTCDPLAVEVLTTARDRARSNDIALHLVHLGAPAARAWLTMAGLS